MLKITNDFNEIDQDDLAVVYFTADWCNPCKQLKPHYGKAAVIDVDKHYYLVDVDKISANLIQKYNIKSIPQIFMMSKGEIIKPILARTSEEIINEIGDNDDNHNRSI